MNVLPESAATDVAVGQAYVLPGEVHATAVPVRYTTILGSCIAICLYDTSRGVAGINHFLLPGHPPGGDREPLRWADASIDELFRRVLALGGDTRQLRAKVFGGAQISTRPVPGSFRIGERNTQDALAALAARDVPVVSHSVGGSLGRKIVFETHTGMVWVKELARSA